MFPNLGATISKHYPGLNTLIQFLFAGTPCQPNFTNPLFSQFVTTVPVSRTTTQHSIQWHSHFDDHLKLLTSPYVHSLLKTELSLCYRVVTSGSIILSSDFMFHPCPHLPHTFHWERTSSLCKALFHQYKDVCNKQFGYLHSTGYYYFLHQCPPGPHNCSGMLYH